MPIHFLKRTCTTIVLCAIIFGGTLYAPNWMFSVGTGVCISLALYEFYSMLKKKGIQVYRVFGISVGLIIPLVVHFQLGYSQSGEVLFIVLACFGLFLLQFTRKDNPHALEAVALTLFGMLYISWFLSFLIRIRFLEGGSILVAYLLVITKIGDIGAYIVGSLLGKHALLPHISPNKSVEGLLGGVALSAISSICFYGILPINISLGHLAFLGGLMGLVGQCGDLSESLIKRYCKAKDSGNGLPGVGGCLDLIDSVLLATPLFFFYIKTHWG